MAHSKEQVQLLKSGIYAAVDSLTAAGYSRSTIGAAMLGVAAGMVANHNPKVCVALLDTLRNEVLAVQAEPEA